MTTSDIRNLTSLSNEARQAAISAFDALGQWRGEISSANDRYLTKVLDQMAVAQRAMGWPDHVTAGAREHLLEGLQDAGANDRPGDECLGATAQIRERLLGCPRGIEVPEPGSRVRNDAARGNDVCSFQAVDAGRRDVAAQLGGRHVGLGRVATVTVDQEGRVSLHLGYSSKLSGERAFLSMLREDVRLAEGTVLDMHADDLGRRSTADLDMLLAEC